jgi:light-regulated signal transduction histidine kinase (bacteriophytochrome)
MDKMESYLGTKTDIQSLSEEVARIVRQILAFDRVVVYQFDEEWNGECIAESLNPLIEGLQSLHGLHFPASDIPPQARKLYARNKVFFSYTKQKIRYLHSRQQKASRLLCRSANDLKQPLDLSFSVLRSMSPIHLVLYIF